MTFCFEKKIQLRQPLCGLGKFLGVLLLSLGVPAASLWCAPLTGKSLSCFQLTSPPDVQRSRPRPFQSRAEGLTRGQRGGVSVEISPRTRPILKLSIVVPVYRELYNGNIARMLNSLGRQSLTEIPFEVVFVVNNSPDIASRSQHPIFVENMRSIEVLKKAKTKFGIKVIDRVQTGIERNMGVLRRIGVRAAIESSGVPHDQHIVVQMDADTVYKSEFLQRVYEMFSASEVETVFFQRSYVLPESADDLMFRTFYKYSLGQIRYSLWQALSYAQVGVATPQITSLASAYLKVGGFPDLAISEDFALTQRLAENTNYIFTGNSKVYVQDRARVDGFDAYVRLNWNQAAGGE